jgi:hypothetical protein
MAKLLEPLEGNARLVTAKELHGSNAVAVLQKRGVSLLNFVAT